VIKRNICAKVSAIIGFFKASLLAFKMGSGPTALRWEIHCVFVSISLIHSSLSHLTYCLSSKFTKQERQCPKRPMAQAIPNYIMSCFKILDGCCDQIENISKIFVGSQRGERKIHWMSWDRLSKSKKKGGLGFRGFRHFNKALLGKHCWRLLSIGESLLARVFKSRYYARSSFMEATTGFQPRYAWRSMLQAREVVEGGARWRIGNGFNVKIWKDSWIPNNGSFKKETLLHTKMEKIFEE